MFAVLKHTTAERVGGKSNTSIQTKSHGGFCQSVGGGGCIYTYITGALAIISPGTAIKLQQSLAYGRGILISPLMTVGC